MYFVKKKDLKIVGKVYTHIVQIQLEEYYIKIKLLEPIPKQYD